MAATVTEIVRRIIHRVYGKSEYTDALTERIAGRIGTWAASTSPLIEGEREVLIASVCFDWMPTAISPLWVAREIEAALVAASDT